MGQDEQDLVYRGDGRAAVGHEMEVPYLADERTILLVNAAIKLGRPLLAMGPPGSGKTRLAESIASELGLPLECWFVKSTTTAREGLYAIDNLRRLHDAQLKDPNGPGVRLTSYLSFGPLGRAIKAGAARDGVRRVVLIDEIDKAEIDFPNDLLRELDRFSFEIVELDEQQLSAAERAAGWQREYSSSLRPIVVVTSNQERELPDAFLRRCVFCWLDFPDPIRLEEIVRANLPGRNIDDSLMSAALERLNEIRAVDGLLREPATSELIDWVSVLLSFGITAATVEASPLSSLPYVEVLLKTRPDQQRVMRAPTVSSP